MTTITISDHATAELLKLQALEAGRNGNFSRIEDRVAAFRYRVYDIVMTEVMKSISSLQKSSR